MCGSTKCARVVEAGIGHGSKSITFNELVDELGLLPVVKHAREALALGIADPEGEVVAAMSTPAPVSASDPT